MYRRRPFCCLLVSAAIAGLCGCNTFIDYEAIELERDADLATPDGTGDADVGPGDTDATGDTDVGPVDLPSGAACLYDVQCASPGLCQHGQCTVSACNRPVCIFPTSVSAVPGDVVRFVAMAPASPDAAIAFQLASATVPAAQVDANGLLTVPADAATGAVYAVQAVHGSDKATASVNVVETAFRPVPLPLGATFGGAVRIRHGDGWRLVAIDHLNPYAWISDDAGLHWRTSADAGWPTGVEVSYALGLVVVADGILAVRGEWDGGVWASTDSGETWHEDAPASDSEPTCAAGDGARAAVCLGNGEVWVRGDTGWTLATSLAPGYGVSAAWSPTVADLLLVGIRDHDAQTSSAVARVTVGIAQPELVAIPATGPNADNAPVTALRFDGAHVSAALRHYDGDLFAFSEDAGATWSEAVLVGLWRYRGTEVRHLAVGPGGELVAATTGGLFRCAAGTGDCAPAGLSRIEVALVLTDASTPSGDTEWLAFSDGQGLFASSTEGVEWEQRAWGQHDVAIVEIVPFAADQLLVRGWHDYPYYGSAGIWTLGGGVSRAQPQRSVQERASEPWSSYYSGSAVRADGALFASIYTYESPTLLTSVDSGDSWTPVHSAPPQVRAIATNEQVLGVLADDGADWWDGSTWSHFDTTGLANVGAGFTDLAPFQHGFVCVSWDGGVYRLDGGGLNQLGVVPGLPGDGNARIVASDDGSVLMAFVLGVHGVYRSEGGASWTALPTLPDSLAPFDLAFAPGSTDVVVLVGGDSSGGVYTSTDSGGSWRRHLNAGLPPDTDALSVAFDPDDARTAYVGTWRGLYVAHPIAGP